MSGALRRVVRIPCGEVALEAALEVPREARGIVVFAHGSGSSRMSPRNRFVAGELRRAGLATLLLDLLTEEEDAAFEARFDVALLAERLAAALRWARAHAATAALPAGLFGAGTGAAAAIEVAAHPAAGVSAVVSRGGRPDLASLAALAALAAPTLLIVGERDAEVIALNEAAYRRMACERTLDVVPGATHLFTESGALETVALLAVEWFTRHLARGPAARAREEAASRP